MSILTLEVGGRIFRADAEAGHDISIALDFHGAQPNHFGSAPAAAEPMRAGEFVGDTRAGGSCNAEVLTINPHCNGTHTECAGHVTRARIGIADVLQDSVFPALLVSVRPVAADETGETADPPPQPGDALITASALGDAWSAQPAGVYPALVVRTLPNPRKKRRKRYTPGDQHPYFTLDALQMIIDCGVHHLLVDTPSVDRYDDQGRLAGHRLFWGIEPGSTRPPPPERAGATVTEMIYVDDALRDGPCLLNLQVAPFLSDAAPSRPILFAAEVT